MIEYLGVKEFAERIGVEPGTVRSYLQKGLLPELDARIGVGQRAVRGWLPEEDNLTIHNG
ncbi:MAG: hypothetical protein SPI12_05875 [Actinomycetaceae bacterium]|nr:hypothetical protein [Actinomycetaceae bacterium]MDY6083366.1 hypothetical protein [Actinomycetaceae bacterium]